MSHMSGYARYGYLVDLDRPTTETLATMVQRSPSEDIQTISDLLASIASLVAEDASSPGSPGYLVLARVMEIRDD